MVEIMPIGKYKGNSVEQIVLKDYDYFKWAHTVISSPSVKERFNFVEHVVNNFISQKPCSLDENPAKHISIYNSYDNYRGSSQGFLYCSSDCFNNDPKILTIKAVLEPLQFRTALSSTKSDTNQLVKIMTECMGIKQERKTKKYLEDFFNNVNTYEKENELIRKFF